MKFVLKIMVILAMTYPSLVSPTYAKAPIRTLQEYSVPELVAHFASQYSVSEKSLLLVMQCESGGNEKAWNKSDPKGGSKGIFQFQQATFNMYAKQLKIENPDIWNSIQQAQVASYMFSKHQEHQWTCAKIMKIV